MIIIVGLGNPGEKYKNTPHNFGFMAIDAFAEKNSFPGFKLSKKFNALISDNIINEEKTILAKPQTFMNESGKSVRKIVSGFKFQVSNLIVVHDDIDLPLGTIKIVKNRGSAGHKGIKSIIKELGKGDFIRIRLGVLQETGKPKSPKRFVLQKFTKEKQILKNQVIEKATEALDVYLKEGLEKAMNEYNK